jgi:hypothetical protein
MSDSEGVCTGFSAYRRAEREMLRLTLDEECNVGHPYAQRNRRDNPVLVPNRDARGLNEAPAAAFWKRRRAEQDIHAKHD